MSDGHDYEVGYGRPPREHQFRPGESGNPKGRQKGSRGLRTDLQAELEGRMTIRINGEPISDTRQRLFVRALASRAATGDLKAAQILAPLIIQVLGTEDRGANHRQLSPQDQAILDEMLSGSGRAADAEPSATDAGGADDRGQDDPPVHNREDEPRKKGGDV